MLIFLTVILGLVLFFLFTPIVFEIDSTRGLCQFRISGLCSVSILFRKDGIWVRIWVLGWQKAFNPFAMRKKSVQAENKGFKEKAKRKWHKINFRKWLRFGKAMLRTFHLDLLYLNVDTGDCVLNSMLFPVAFFLTTKQRSFRINYRGDVVLKLRASNTRARIFATAMAAGISIIMQK